MNKIQIVKSGTTLTKEYWALLRNSSNEYGIITTVSLVEPKEIDFDYILYKMIQWLPFESTSHLDLSITKSEIFYNKNSVLRFGMYKGYEVGVVYSFDAPYLEWCIENISDFYIEDIDELENFGVIRYNQRYEMFREIAEGSLNSWVNYFSTIQDIVKEFGLAYTNYRFSESARLLNRSKIANQL